MKLLMLLLSFVILLTSSVRSQSAAKELAPLHEGIMDIHIISTGRGNASFMVFPDGTTMLIDAGDLNKAETDKSIYPLKVSPALPDSVIRSGEVIAAYIKHFMPKNRLPEIDYVLITHFHGDHYGDVSKDSPLSKNGFYRLSGITDVGDIIPIKNMIDRGYPSYNYPVNLISYYHKNLTFNNYLSFVKYQAAHHGMKAGSLLAGSDSQIKLLYNRNKYTDFSVRNIKTNGTLWLGKDTSTINIFKPLYLLENGKFNENPLSNAIKITYGNFSYYSGGENTGFEGAGYPGIKDVETPMARAIGKVEAMTLDHHGNRDATNNTFIKTLSPKVVVEQSWCSDQPGQEVAFRLTDKRDSMQVFDTFMQNETKAYLGFWIAKAFKSFEGHIVIRVMPGGKEYRVYVLNDRSEGFEVLGEFGPYTAHSQ